MGDIIVNARVLEQCRTTGGDDDYDLIEYTFSEYMKAIDAINTICADKHKHVTFEFKNFGEFGILEPIIFFFKRNEEGEFICNNVPDHKTARELLRGIHCNRVVAKKEQEHVWITIKDWRVVESMHEAGYCVRYASPVLQVCQYITSIDYDDRRFETSYDHNKALVMTAGDAEKFVKSFPEECMGFLEICEVYKHDENDILRGNKLPAVVIDDFEDLTTQ